MKFIVGGLPCRDLTNHLLLRIVIGEVTRDISAIMRSVRSFDTEAEVRLRKAIWRAGLRYRIHERHLPGKPDIVFPSPKLAVFVDGDLWHGNQWRLRGLASLEDQFANAKNPGYWLGKIRKNMQRDAEATSTLLSLGWRVLRFWESDIYRDLEDCVNMTREAAQNNIQPDSYSQVPVKAFAEFFAGIGLVRMALERQGWSVAYADDMDEQKYEMYKAQFPDVEKHYDKRDIHEVPAADVPAVTLATASFPCNDLSLAGSRKGLLGSQSAAFWGFVKILRDMEDRRPPIVMLENVPGFLTSHGGNDFRDALVALNDLGYTVDALVLDAAWFVPQSRQRLFVIGLLDPRKRTMPIIEFPIHWESDVRPRALRDFVFNNTSINWRLRNLPDPVRSEVHLDNILENLPDDASEWWSEDRAKYLLNQMSPRHRKIADEMVMGDDWSYGTVFRRVRQGRSMAELRTDGIAGCLRTPRGGSGRQILFKAGKGMYSARLLTPRECARLMGADDYHITVPLNQALFGFGDAVCVPAIEWLAKYYLNPVVNEMIRGVPLIPDGEEVAV